MDLEFDDTTSFIIQDYIRVILGIIIISNFILIICLKFKMRIKEKRQLLAKDIKKSHSKELNNTEGEIIDNKPKYALFIIAHPDDEIMFFSPTLINLQEISKVQPINIHILCLTNGNFYNQGLIREQEMKNVLDKLNITKYKIVNSDKFIDSMTTKYSLDDVSNEIDAYIKSQNDESLSLIFSFDHKGVTKHPNHISCNEGLINYLKVNKSNFIKEDISIYLLDTYIFPIQYFTQLLVMFLYYVNPYGSFTCSPRKIYNIMSCYVSQMTWFRKLHILFSAYSYINTYTKIEFDQESDKLEDKKLN
jgi:N-acetylglucosaminylphosphatidylinositol deacetylase